MNQRDDGPMNHAAALGAYEPVLTDIVTVIGRGTWKARKADGLFYFSDQTEVHRGDRLQHGEDFYEVTDVSGVGHYSLKVRVDALHPEPAPDTESSSS